MARALKFGLYCLWSLVWCGLLLTVAAPAPTAVAFVDSIEDAYKWVQHSLHIAEKMVMGAANVFQMLWPGSVSLHPSLAREALRTHWMR